ncbi:Putative succinyl-CoA transferase [Defluviimonas aquaemixtae]|uniref:Succinyl-CoA transferase n=1 Tax=Albidovulum aquaemixtae TaxID=1542388 RepID=A0A2R8B6Z5_9RHOB|nr:GNAT family N-acetyltransferase [Defluviimonas aquaemixtae]SPH18389.1 Putative succinyl-CoA transferase [Defluviimonas aquaemixtae]
MPSRSVIKTARLTLRPPVAEDEADVVAALNGQGVARWLTRVPRPYGTSDFRTFLPAARPGAVWAIVDAKGFSGMIGLNPGLGFWLASHARGRGYATEAARAVLAAQFADRTAGPVRSGHLDGNTAAAGVLRKLGFRPDGFRIVRVAARAGESVRLRSFALSRADWLAANPLEIETARLMLKPLDPDRDWRDLSRIGGDPRVAPMLRWALSPWPETEVRRWVNLSRWRGHPGFRLGVFVKDGPLIGVVGLFPDPANVMYFLDPGHWGRGCMTEALRAFLDWAVTCFDLTEIEADHFADNPASGRVLEKLGFARTGTGTGTSAARPGPAPNVLWHLTVPPSSA